MFKNILLTLVLLVGTLFCGLGCQDVQLTSAEMKLAAYGGAYVGSLATTEFLITEDKLTLGDVRKVAEVLRALEDPLNEIQAQEHLYIVIYPFIEKVILGKLDKPTQQNLALATTGVGLRLADQVLKKYPSIIENKDEWTGFLKEIIRGLTLGMLDAIDEPADSPLRKTVAWRQPNAKTYALNILVHRICNCGMCRSNGLTDDRRLGLLDNNLVERHSEGQLGVPRQVRNR